MRGEERWGLRRKGREGCELRMKRGMGLQNRCELQVRQTKVKEDGCKKGRGDERKIGGKINLMLCFSCRSLLVSLGIASLFMETGSVRALYGKRVERRSHRHAR